MVSVTSYLHACIYRRWDRLRAAAHDEADRALIAIADVLRTTFRRGDLIARLADDEFVVLAEGDAHAAQQLQARLAKG